jgi:tellurite resistance protein TehA-like permease
VDKAYTSSTLVMLGTQAAKVLPHDYLGLHGPYPVGYIWKAIGVPAGIFFWLFGFWNFALTTVSVLFGIRKMHFDMSWWAFIFPNAGLTIAAIQIGNVLESKPIKDVCSAATIVLCIGWLVVAVFHVRAIIRKEVLCKHLSISCPIDSWFEFVELTVPSFDYTMYIMLPCY